MKAILFGILASFFFAVTFVINKLMSDGGGSWIWSASLRYLFMLPILIIIVSARKNLRPLFEEMRKHPWGWVGWSMVGFGLFYGPLCFAAKYSPAWLVAGTWQFTIISGSLVVPFFYETRMTKQGPKKVRKRIPFKRMGMSVLILIGIVVMEWSHAHRVSLGTTMTGMIPILIATFAYPLGNRKMMELCVGRVDAYQRTLGMTIATLPLWLVLCAYQFSMHGLPSKAQVFQCLIVAVLSGVVATVLFFKATDMAQGNVTHLATIEATQSGEVVFTLIGELLLIAGTKISVMGCIGIFIVVMGMIGHSLLSSRKRTKESLTEMVTEDYS